MDLLAAELAAGFADVRELTRPLLRLVLAVLCGAVIGMQRERAGKSAGLRTHILVAAGTALFIVVALDVLGYGVLDNPREADALSRVIQGLATGIGFLGAGAILKLEKEQNIRGLTTAAGIWMTAAIGVTVGLGRFGLAVAATILTWVVLSLLRQLERWAAISEPGDES